MRNYQNGYCSFIIDKKSYGLFKVYRTFNIPSDFGWDIFIIIVTNQRKFIIIKKIEFISSEKTR